MLDELNTPHRKRTSLRPSIIIDALSQPNPKVHRSKSRLFSSREHQDAQELFQLVSSCIQEEAAEVNAESSKDVGLAGVKKDSMNGSINGGLGVGAPGPGKNVFEGLTANRRTCVECEYTEAVMHFSFDNLTLTVPREVCIESTHFSPY